MTVWSRLGERVLRRIEAHPAIREASARAARAEAFTRVARDLACSPKSDSEALSELRSQVPDDEAGLAMAIEQTSLRRSDYASDREYRLLAALADHAPVRGMDPALADLFDSERELGWLPLSTPYFADRRVSHGSFGSLDLRPSATN